MEVHHVITTKQQQHILDSLSLPSSQPLGLKMSACDKCFLKQNSRTESIGGKLENSHVLVFPPETFSSESKQTTSKHAVQSSCSKRD